MRKLSVVVAVALLAGCSTMGHQKQTRVTSAQTEAEKSLEQARDMQAKASDQQRKADQAESDVRQKEKDLADAQTRAQQERRKAESMQAQAEQATQRATERAQSSQQQASQAQRQERDDLAKPSIATGTLVRASEDRVTIDQDGKEIELSVSGSADVTINGEKAGVADLPVGSEVRASFRPGQPLPRAESIEVTAPEGGQDMDEPGSAYPEHEDSGSGME